MLSLFEKRPWLSWILVIIIAAFIFFMSSMTFETSSVGFGWKTIVYHFLVFFLLAFFLLLAIVKGKRENLIVLSIILAILYCISDEIHQLFVIGRSCSFSDMLVNSSGIFSSSLIYTISLRNKLKNKVKVA